LAKLVTEFQNTGTLSQFRYVVSNMLDNLHVGFVLVSVSRHVGCTVKHFFFRQILISRFPYVEIRCILI